MVGAFDRRRGAFITVLRYLIAIVILAGLAAGGWYAWKAYNEPPADAGGQQAGGFAIPVDAVPVRQADLLRTVQAVGTLVADEEVTIRPEISGILTAIAFEEGQRIEKDAVLFSLDSQILQAELDQAKASLALSQANYDRALSLAERGSGTQRAKDEAQAALLNDQAAVVLAEQRLAKTVISAPFEGVLGLRHVSIGDYVVAGDEMVTLSAIDQLKADFRIPELFLAEVNVGQELNITADALPGQTFEGKVYAIDPQVDVSGRALVIRARLDNPDGKLRPGLFARIDVVLERRANALLLPESAIVPTKQGQTVFRITDGAAEVVTVTTGLRRKGEIEILSGLNVGDMVVIGGQLKLRPGAPVQVVGPAPAAPAGGAPTDGGADGQQGGTDEGDEAQEDATQGGGTQGGGAQGGGTEGGTEGGSTGGSSTGGGATGGGATGSGSGG